MNTTSEQIPDEGLRTLTAELKRRRDRIAKVHRSRAVVLGAYDLVAADLRAAYGEETTTSAVAKLAATA
jgi:hypothetical protein